MDERELHFEYIRASGPGGQNVNKVATAVQMRFDIANSALASDIKGRLIRLAGNRVTADGVLMHRSKTLSHPGTKSRRCDPKIRRT